MDTEQVREQAQVDGWAWVDGEWREIVNVDGEGSTHHVMVARRGWLPASCIEAVAPPSDDPPDCGAADPFLFDLAVARVRERTGQQAARDLLRDGGAR